MMSKVHTIEDLQKSFIGNLSEYFKSYNNKGCGIEVFCTTTTITRDGEETSDAGKSELDLFDSPAKFIEVVRIMLEIYDLEKKVIEGVDESQQSKGYRGS